MLLQRVHIQWEKDAMRMLNEQRVANFVISEVLPQESTWFSCKQTAYIAYSNSIHIFAASALTYFHELSALSVRFLYQHLAPELCDAVCKCAWYSFVYNTFASLRNNKGSRFSSQNDNWAVVVPQFPCDTQCQHIV